MDTAQRFFDALHRPHHGYRLLTWTVAGLMLFHGAAKLSHGLGFVTGMLESHGLPTFLAYGALIGEVVAPVLVLAGVLVAPAALVMAINMLVAIALAHGAQLVSLNSHGGYALEIQAFYLFGSIAIGLMAPRGGSRASARLSKAVT